MSVPPDGAGRHEGGTGKRAEYEREKKRNGVLQRVALLLTYPHRRCTTLAQKSSSWASVDAAMVGMVQLHSKPL
jgi:hypothetical protein